MREKIQYIMVKHDEMAAAKMYEMLEIHFT